MPQPFDITLIARGARIRRSPFFDATQKHGCRSYTVYNHMFLPSRYDDLEKEYWKLVNGVTLWDVSVERIVEITRPDGFAFTSLLTPPDLGKCKVAHGKYALITDEKRGISNEPLFVCL